MSFKTPRWINKTVIWAALILVISVPIIAAANSPLLAWRDAIYIAAGFAGVAALAILLIQPLLIGGYLPGLHARRGRLAHRVIGGLLVIAIVIHVVALWITSPPDVADALLFRSPTPFSIWGVIAMWVVFASALLATFRRRLRPRSWRLIHTIFAAIIVLGSVVHALLIQGTMETISKGILCALVVAITVKVVADLWGWPRRTQ